MAAKISHCNDQEQKGNRSGRYKKCHGWFTIGQLLAYVKNSGVVADMIEGVPALMNLVSHEVDCLQEMISGQTQGTQGTQGTKGTQGGPEPQRRRDLRDPGTEGTQGSKGTQGTTGATWTSWAP